MPTEEWLLDFAKKARAAGRTDLVDKAKAEWKAMRSSAAPSPDAFAGAQATVAPWMLGLGGVGIVVGLSTWGYRVIETVGKKITQLTPSRGFAAELGAASTIVVASRLGIPVSTTHILVGAVLGVGLSRGIGALDLRVVGRIIVSWVATLPIAASLCIGFFSAFRALLGD